MKALITALRARFNSMGNKVAAWKQQRARRKSDRPGGQLPVRDRLHIPGTREVRLTVFDQSLVMVVCALLLLGVVMVN